MLLKNKKALVTGSSRGIGRGIVESYLKNGCEVWGLCSKPSEAKDALENLAKENGTSFHEIYADVGNEEQVTQVVKDALKESYDSITFLLHKHHPLLLVHRHVLDVTHRLASFVHHR